MNDLKKSIEQIKKTCITACQQSTSLEALEAVRITFLGRKGTIAQLMPQLKILSTEEKRVAGSSFHAFGSRPRAPLAGA